MSAIRPFFCILVLSVTTTVAVGQHRIPIYKGAFHRSEKTVHGVLNGGATMVVFETGQNELDEAKNRLSLWDLKSYKKISDFVFPPIKDSSQSNIKIYASEKSNVVITRHEISNRRSQYRVLLRWDLATGKYRWLRSIRANAVFRSESISPDGRYMAWYGVSGRTSCVEVMDTSNGKTAHIIPLSLGGDDHLLDIKWSSDNHIAICVRKSPMTVFAVYDLPKKSWVFATQAKGVYWPSIALAPKNRLVFCFRRGTDQDTRVAFQIWDYKLRKLLNRFSIPMKCSTVNLSAGERLLMCDYSSWVGPKVIDMTTGQITELAYAKDFTDRHRYFRLLSDTTAVGWGIFGHVTMLRLHRMPSGHFSPMVLNGHKREIAGLAVSQDGKMIVTGGMYYDKTIRLWDARTGKQVKRLTGLPNGLQTLALSRDGKTLATGSYGEKFIRLWNLASGKCERQLMGHKSDVKGLAFSPDGKTLVSCTAYSKDAVIWDVVTGKKVDVLKGERDDRVEHVAFSPDGKRIVTCGRNGNHMRLWDAATRKQLWAAKARRLRTAHFSPDGKQIVTADRTSVKLWDTVTGKMIAEMKHGSVESAVFSPDGKFIASTDPSKSQHNGWIKVWDAKSLKLSGTLRAPATALNFSPDGNHVIAAVDRRLMIWDVNGRDFAKE